MGQNKESGNSTERRCMVNRRDQKEEETGMVWPGKTMEE
jgi:hypothetical protein